jgi:hypothetical protein
MASAAPLAARDGHFLAGFIEAEGSFAVRPNNGGESWQCSMSLSLRDDDAELLADLARLTGLGVLSAVPARATSKPQFLWKITSQPECQRLSELIELYPLRGRKRAEAAVWSRAVRALREGPRTPELPLAHRELRSLRRYVDPERRDATIVELPESELAPYLGGLFTGEGHLSISTGRCE